MTRQTWLRRCRHGLCSHNQRNEGMSLGRDVFACRYEMHIIQWASQGQEGHLFLFVFQVSNAGSLPTHNSFPEKNYKICVSLKFLEVYYCILLIVVFYSLFFYQYVKWRETCSFIFKRISKINNVIVDDIKLQHYLNRVERLTSNDRI